MRTGRPATLAVLTAALTSILLIGGVSGPATAQEPQDPTDAPTAITVPPMGQMWGFVPMEVVHTAGSEAVLYISDFVPHTVTARQTDADGYPLFQSGRTEPGDTRSITGVADLPPGTYRFYCSIHTNMPGTLHVVADPAGANEPDDEEDQEPSTDEGDGIRTDRGDGSTSVVDETPRASDTDDAGTTAASNDDEALPSTGGSAALPAVLVLGLTSFVRSQQGSAGGRRT